MVKDLPASEEFPGDDQRVPADRQLKRDEHWRSRRRRFVAALKPARRAAPLTLDEADIPVLDDVVLAETSEAAVPLPEIATPEPRAEVYLALAAELRETVDKRLADELPTLLASSLADTVRTLRQTIDASIASALNDFIRQRETLCTSPAQPTNEQPDTSTLDGAPESEPSPHPV